ncbi:MAG: hypothetical protein JNJ61_27130 [Anaerolineae bacterium]|nr:hypothetical protein [Anaerolineae bacterium]
MYRIKSAILIVALLFTLLLALTPPALAQEETREPGELATLAVVPTQIVMTSAPPEATRVPVVIGEPIVLQPGETNTTLYIVTVIVVTVGCGAIVMIQQRNISALLGSMNQVLTDKAVRDEAERKYMESSLSVQHAIQFLGAAFQYAGNLNLPVVDATVDRAAEFIKDITDGNPNTGQALTAPKVPQYDEGAG